MASDSTMFITKTALFVVALAIVAKSAKAQEDIELRSEATPESFFYEVKLPPATPDDFLSELEPNAPEVVHARNEAMRHNSLGGGVSAPTVISANDKKSDRKARGIAA